MVDNFEAGRRRFLQGAGIGGTALLAGCTEQLGLDDDGDGSDEVDGVGIVASIDQEELQTLQVEIQQEVQQAVQQEVEDGELAEDEAQQEVQRRLQERQGEIITFIEEQIAAMKTEVQAESSIEILEEYPRAGAVRADGDAEELIAALNLDTVQQLVSASGLQAPEQQNSE
ncbi:hypothetical protein ACFQH2_01580 [Natronoarchaeum sp. GCM10025703]|uniref:hypothetical protein n=1 Tax=unclassified Natronoarchaeum TaxID=2620183 RepID=UPI00361C1809